MHEDSGSERRDQSMGRRIAAMFLTDPAYPGYDEADQASQDSVILLRPATQSVRSTAPSGTTPFVTYRQSATMSLRAIATIVIRRSRPRSAPTRSRNHRLSTESG